VAEGATLSLNVGKRWWDIVFLQVVTRHKKHQREEREEAQ